MSRISLEHTGRLLNTAISRINTLGKSSCRYALLTASDEPALSADSFLPNLELGIVRYHAGPAPSPRQLRVRKPEQTRYGTLGYKTWTESLPTLASMSEDDKQTFFSITHGWAANNLRALGAGLLAHSDIPISAAWAEGTDSDARYLRATIYLPEDTTPDRMATLMALQGHRFDENGLLAITSPHESPDMSSYVVHYGFNQPPAAKATD